jgi:hypothetical protein
MVDFFGQVWREAASIPESAYSGSEPPAPGNYIIQLVGHEVGEDRGDAYVALDFQLVGVPHSMQHRWRDWRGFGTPERAVAAYRICAKLGVNPNRVQTPGDLDIELRRLQGCCYYARIAQRGEWRNLFVNEQLPAMAADALLRAAR